MSAVPYLPLRLRETVLTGRVHPDPTSERLAPTDRVEWASVLQEVRALVAAAPTVRIDNVLAAFDESARVEELWAGIPVCVPPVTPLWLEGTGPVPLADGEGRHQVQVRTLGALVNARSTGPGATMHVELWLFLGHDPDDAIARSGCGTRLTNTEARLAGRPESMHPSITTTSRSGSSGMGWPPRRIGSASPSR
jgi:hypothetical protein